MPSVVPVTSWQLRLENISCRDHMSWNTGVMAVSAAFTDVKN